MERNNQKPNKRTWSFLNFFISNVFYLVFILVTIFFSLTAKEFFTVSNISVIFLHSAPFFIVASGLAFVIISGDFDLSVGSVAFISVSLGALLIDEGIVSLPVGIIIALLAGTILGFFNGIIITKLKVPAFITTLGMLIGGRGIGLMLTLGTNRSEIFIPDALREFSKLKWGPVYVEIIISVAVMLIAQFLLSRTPFGKKIYAIGNDKKAAERIGINIGSYKLLLFTMSGFFASFAGIIYLTQVGNVHSQFAFSWEFTAISMAVIGGVSLYGGIGRVIPGVLMGVVLIIMIDNGLNVLGASPYLYPFIKGLIIFIAIYADSFKNYIYKGRKLAN